jgi:hypothetical protein
MLGGLDRHFGDHRTEDVVSAMREKTTDFAGGEILIRHRRERGDGKIGMAQPSDKQLPDKGKWILAVRSTSGTIERLS